MHTKDTQFADWLCWFGASDQDSMWNKTSQPFRVADGRAATNGKYAVLVRDGGPKIELDKEKIVSALTTFFFETAEGVTMRFAELRSLVGECDHPAVDVCQDCKGTGKVDHVCGCDLCDEDEETCGNCDGKGKAVSVPDYERTVKVFGEPFDANMLAYVLEHLPAADDCQIYLIRKVADQQSHHLHIVSSQWHALLVGLLNGPKDAPELLAMVQSEKE